MRGTQLLRLLSSFEVYPLGINLSMDGPVAVIWSLFAVGWLFLFPLPLIYPQKLHFWRDTPSRWVASGVYLGVFFLLVAGWIVLAVANPSMTSPDYFEENEGKVVSRVDSLIDAGKPEVALDTMEKYLGGWESRPVLESFQKRARADTLYKSVLEIPASEIEQNIEAYERLTDLDPDRELFQRKLSHYQHLKEQREQRKREQARREYLHSQAWAEKNRAAARVMCQNFVEERLRSPSTASYPWERVPTQYLGEGRFRIDSHVDAQNSFGAEVRTEYTCTVEHAGSEKWSLVSLDMR